MTSSNSDLSDLPSAAVGIVDGGVGEYDRIHREFEAAAAAIAARFADGAEIPTCAPGSPAWLIAVRDRFVATGKIHFKLVWKHLAVGEKFIAVSGAWSRVTEDELHLDDLSYDEKRVWCVVPSEIA